MDGRFGAGSAAGAAQDGFDAGDQFTRVERLGHIVVGPQFQPHDLVHAVVAGGEHDDGQVGRELAGPHAAADLPAIHLRQHQVEHHQRRGLAGDQVQRRGPVAGRLHTEPLSFEIHPRQFDDVGLVVHDQNCLSCHRPSHLQLYPIADKRQDPG